MIIRADLRSNDASSTLLQIRNLETSRLWTNDPNAVIQLDTHLAYVASRLGDTPEADRMIVYFVVGDDGAVVGYQRFDIDREDPATWFVSTAFGPSAQGKGYGTRSMGESIMLLRDDLVRIGRPIKQVFAWIHPENVPSLKMCVRNGFVRESRTITDKAGRQMDLYAHMVVILKQHGFDSR